MARGRRPESSFCTVIATTATMCEPLPRARRNGAACEPLCFSRLETAWRSNSRGRPAGQWFRPRRNASVSNTGQFVPTDPIRCREKISCPQVARPSRALHFPTIVRLVQDARRSRLHGIRWELSDSYDQHLPESRSCSPNLAGRWNSIGRRLAQETARLCQHSEGRTGPHPQSIRIPEIHHESRKTIPFIERAQTRHH